MELLAVALVALLVQLLVGFPMNGHGGGWYPWFGPDGDKGSSPLEPEPWTWAARIGADHAQGSWRGD